MIVWTPSQWEQELNSFAARVHVKDYERIPYTNWRIVVGFTKLEPSKKIVLAIDSTGKMTLTASNSQFSMNSYGMLSLRDYLEDTYFELPIQAASNLAFNVNDLTAYRKVELSNSNYATATAKAAVLNSIDNTAAVDYNTSINWIYSNKSDSTGYYSSNGIYSPSYATQSEVDNIKAQIENIKTNISENKKEKEDMNFFKNFEFGPVKNDTVRLSPYGLAVKNLDNSWVAYDAASDSIIDVDVFNFEGKNLIYKIPAAPHTVRAGDMIVHQGKAMYVLHDVEEGDTSIVVIDPRAGESKEILPTRSPFGFNVVTKLVSLLDMSGISANTDSPFGNLLPLALMGDKDCDTGTMMAMMMMMNGGNCDFNLSDPMTMLAFTCGNDSDKTMLLSMMLMAGRK